MLRRPSPVVLPNHFQRYLRCSRECVGCQGWRFSIVAAMLLARVDDTVLISQALPRFVGPIFQKASRTRFACVVHWRRLDSHGSLPCNLPSRRSFFWTDEKESTESMRNHSISCCADAHASLGVHSSPHRSSLKQARKEPCSEVCRICRNVIAANTLPLVCSSGSGTTKLGQIRSSRRVFVPAARRRSPNSFAAILSTPFNVAPAYRLVSQV